MRGYRRPLSRVKSVAPLDGLHKFITQRSETDKLEIFPQETQILERSFTHSSEVTQCL